MATFTEFADSNSNGFSMLAVKAGAADTASFLEGLSDVVEYDRSCKIGEVIYDEERGMLLHPDGSYLQITAHPEKRTSYLVKATGSDWCILYRTIEWAQGEDCQWVQATAEALSKALGTDAISVSGSYVCDCRVYSNGQTAKKQNGVDSDKVAKIFDEHGIDVPNCTIAGDPACLMATASEAEKISESHQIQLVV